MEESLCSWEWRKACSNSQNGLIVYISGFTMCCINIFLNMILNILNHEIIPIDNAEQCIIKFFHLGIYWADSPFMHSFFTLFKWNTWGGKKQCLSHKSWQLPNYLSTEYWLSINLTFCGFAVGKFQIKRWLILLDIFVYIFLYILMIHLGSTNI